MSLKRFAIEELVGSLVLSSIPISGRDKLFKYLLVSNSVLLAAFSKIVLYEYCQTLLTFTCLIPPHSLDGKFSLSRPRLVAWSRSCGLAAGCWMLDAPFDSSPEFITPELEQPWLVLQTGHLHKVIYCPFTHPSYCKSHGEGVMLQLLQWLHLVQAQSVY